MHTFDDTVLKRSTRDWLTRHNAMPSAWKLPEQELERWLQAGVRICVFNSPACLVSIGAETQIPSPRLQLALVDAYKIDDWVAEHGFAREELIATILHEIGHAVNCPKYPMGLGEEFGADDYARHCGYEAPLRSALEKILKLDPKHCELDAFQQRIQRIHKKEPIELAWLSPV
ncbi:hypothetical protein HZ994_02410 [Akkermansiaceae bacterium]|nr:hypothetical protein HZ994_02410 [Akkermansiaceae bacterium]